jgi:hypothetical protein
LDVVGGLWADFKPIMENASKADTTSISAADVQKMASANLPLLKEMNKAVQMYEQLAN